MTGVQGLRPIDQARKDVPGTIDFMRTKIKHVVYYMVENCSFDHACGWLYEKNEQIVNFVGHTGPQGADPSMFNFDLMRRRPREGISEEAARTVQRRQGGIPENRPVSRYDRPDPPVLFDGIRHDRNGYAKRERHTWAASCGTTATTDAMLSCTPDKLPVVNGLAKAFAVSDEWFCSMPGATDSNCAFALTGSALRQLNNFMNGPKYIDWPDPPHRASIWKVLWANGFTEWKIYNSMPWFHNAPRFVLTYHLFLRGQIETVDAEVAAHLAGSANTSKYVGTIDQFMDDAQSVPYRPSASWSRSG